MPTRGRAGGLRVHKSDASQLPFSFPLPHLIIPASYQPLLPPLSSIMSTRTIAVVGSTGEQGTGVVAAVLSSTSFIVRALTRDPSSDKAKALVAAHQAHVDAGRLVVVQANLDDVESLKKAVEGAQVVFGMTTPSLNEVQQGKNLVDAVKVRLGFSSLNDDSR